MTLAEEIQLRVYLYGGNEVVARDINREWGFFLVPVESLKPRPRTEHAIWTDKELAYLIKYIKLKPVLYISKHLKRTVPAVYSKAYKLGLLEKAA